MQEFSARDDIERSIKELKINREEFFEISKLQWQEILLKITECFVRKRHYTNDLHWAWERLKEPNIGLGFKDDCAYKYISEIIADSYYIHEYYIVSKKYEWLLCENHHGSLCGSGEKIVNQIKNFKARQIDVVY